MTKALLYMHGFRSSPQSHKARIMQELCGKSGIDFTAPDLNMPPKDALDKLSCIFSELSKSHDEVALVGSSLGGFYCARLAQQTGARAALLNPAVQPWEVVKNYLGEQTIYGTTRTILVTPDYADQLQALQTPSFDDPGRVLLVLATGDEVLDWSEAAALYNQSPSLVINGGDHGLSGFAEQAPAVMRFLFESFF